MNRLNYWLIVFLFLFTIASIGVFLLEFGTTANLILSVGWGIVIVSILFAGVLIVYLFALEEDKHK